MSNIVIGLDGEMSSAELRLGGRLIQIGVAFSLEESDRFCATIGWDDGDWAADPRAMMVHGISADTIRDAPRADVVDDELYAFLLAHGGSADHKKLLTCGWNVVAFDLPFVQDALPRSFSLLSRRGVDLNGVTETMSDLIHLGGSKPSWSGWKRLAKRAAQRALSETGEAAAWHDAGYDAAAALASRNWLRQVLAGEITA